MAHLSEHQQIVIDDICANIDATVPVEAYGKIDWANLLAFLMRLIEVLAPIILPLLVTPPEPKPNGETK